MKNSNSNLNPKKSESTDISKPWDKDNQAWWDWYVSLADNDSKEHEIININPLPDIQIPSDDEVISELAEPYHLTNDQVNFFKFFIFFNSCYLGKIFSHCRNSRVSAFVNSMAKTHNNFFVI